MSENKSSWKGNLLYFLLGAYVSAVTFMGINSFLKEKPLSAYQLDQIETPEEEQKRLNFYKKVQKNADKLEVMAGSLDGFLNNNPQPQFHRYGVTSFDNSKGDTIYRWYVIRENKSVINNIVSLYSDLTSDRYVLRIEDPDGKYVQPVVISNFLKTLETKDFKCKEILSSKIDIEPVKEESQKEQTLCEPIW